MENQLLHTPEGVRDIYNGECERKLEILARMNQEIRKYGYHPIQTPTFEFFDIFGKEVGTTPSRDLYKFFDREGNTLVLRPDMAPPVARAANRLIRSTMMLSTRDTPDTADSPTLATMILSAIPTRTARNCSTIRGRISTRRSRLLKRNWLLSRFPANDFI